MKKVILTTGPDGSCMVVFILETKDGEEHEYHAYSNKDICDLIVFLKNHPEFFEGLTKRIPWFYPEDFFI